MRLDDYEVLLTLRMFTELPFKKLLTCCGSSFGITDACGSSFGITYACDHSIIEII